MKHSCKSILGIKMDSNKHGAMEWNEEDTQTNKMIYHMRKTELRMMRYGLMNIAKKYAEKGIGQNST